MTKKSINSWINGCIVVVLLCTVVACKNNRGQEALKNRVGTVIGRSNSIQIFGSLHIDNVLKLSAYEKYPLVDALVKGMLPSWKSALNIDIPIYYASERTNFSSVSDIDPTYLFVEVKNKDSLRALLVKNGYQPQEKSSFSYIEDKQVHVGFDDYTMIVLLKDLRGNVDVVPEIFDSLFKIMSGKTSIPSRVNEILNNKHDLVAGIHLENWYHSNQDFFFEEEALETQKKMDELLKDNFIATTFSFENGRLVAEIQNHFSKQVKDRFFLAPPTFSKNIEKVTCADPSAGSTVNIDVRKLHEFIEEYFPNTLEELNRGFKKKMLVSFDDALKMFDGRVVAISCDSKWKDVNAFVGLTDSGKTLLSSFGFMLSFAVENYDVVDDGIVLYSGRKPKLGASKTKTPQDLFGKHSVVFFQNGKDLDKLLFGKSSPIGKYGDLLQSMELHYDLEGGKLVLSTVNSDDNILQQILEQFIERAFNL